MSQTSPAGWYPQPDGSQRYWDGAAWTAHHPAAVVPAPPAYLAQPGMVVAPKNPALALIVSFFVPGVGTMINGEVGKGIGILAGYVVGVVLSIVLIGIPILLGFWIWGMVDAYQGAQKWNAAHGIRKLRSVEGSVLVAGVSGSGKSTVGRLLAEALGAAYVEGDDLHPAANRATMAAGVPLTDDDRRPWLDAVAVALGEPPVVAACSALKHAYRGRLRESVPDLFVVLLDGEPDLLRQRQGAREGHFMPASLMDSQLATLEPLRPEEAGVRLDVAASPDALVRAALVALERLA